MSVAYIFDTECTDKDDARQIIEAAWIRMPAVQDLAGRSDRICIDPAAEYKSYEERFKPTRAISFGAMAVHHILPHELLNCQPHTAFELPIDTTYLIGHSIDFDWQVAGAPTQVKRICTHAIAQHVFQECDSLSLSALLYFATGPSERTRQLVKGAHGAMQDCWNVLQLLRVILAKKPGIDTWEQLHKFSEACREPLRMPMGRNRGALLTDCDTGELEWYLDQPWIDPYFRRALQRVVKDRGRDLFSAPDEDFDEDLDDDFPVDLEDPATEPSKEIH